MGKIALRRSSPATAGKLPTLPPLTSLRNPLFFLRIIPPQPAKLHELLFTFAITIKQPAHESGSSLQPVEQQADNDATEVLAVQSLGCATMRSCHPSVNDYFSQSRRREHPATCTMQASPVGFCGSAAHFRAAIAALCRGSVPIACWPRKRSRLLDGCEWVGIPFAGGMSEVPHIKVRTVVVNDLHEGIITLGRVTADSKLGPQLYRRLRRKLLHPLELRGAQDRCRLIESLVEETRERVDDAVLLTWAEHYFTAVWMARAGAAGTDRELDAGLALRWNAGGGDSAMR